MTATEQKAIDALKALSPESQLLVMASVGEGMTGFAPGYKEIVQRRQAEMESGEVEGISHNEVMRRLRAKVADAR